ncbi:MOSC domain-containing protein [Glycomyces sp. NPDC047010]|uniref:MOSC domain-containing protein n=1 Tax=Glycomyces sp. NPDC047010 TaxID=3155023 RepID=UPI00340787D7
MNRVLGIRRHPLKSAAAEHVDQTRIGKHGLDGDRTWVCVDADGTIGSAKQPRLWGALLDVDAVFDPDGEDVLVTAPNGLSGTAGTPEADAAVSEWLGRPVRLTRTASQRLKRHHWWPDEPGMIPEWAADAVPGGDAIVDVRHDAADGRFFDFGPLHLVTTGALDRLSAEHGTAVDPVRFRPNLVLDLPDDPEPGRRLTIGEVSVEVLVPTPRCVIPSITHRGNPNDPALLKTLAKHHRRDVPDFGRATCFGFYAEILNEGVVRVGDEVVPA